MNPENWQMQLNFTKPSDNGRYGFVCDCGNAEFQIIGPDIVECECGFVLGRIEWRVAEYKLVLEDDDTFNLWLEI